MVGLTYVYRVVTFIPTEHGEGPEKNVEKIITAVSGIIPLQFGKYDCVCWYSAPGKEQFRPLSESSPTAGQEGELSSEPSVRLEFSVPKDAKLLQRVIDEAIVPNHPCEEPVILIFEAIETRTQSGE